MRIQESIERLQELATDAINELLIMQQELAVWQSEALRLTVRCYTPDSEEVQEHLNQLVELGVIAEGATLGEATRRVAEVSAKMAETITEMAGEIPQHINFQELFGLKDPNRICVCGHDLADSDEYCPVCGKQHGAKVPYVAPETIRCHKCTCGRTYDSRFRFCPECGKEKTDIFENLR